MPRLNHISIKKSTGLFGKTLFALFFIFGCMDFVEAKAFNFDNNENVSLTTDAKIEEEPVVSNNVIYVVEGTVIHNLEDKANTEIVYVKKNSKLKEKTSKHKRFVDHKSAKPDLKEKVQQKEEIRKKFNFLGTNKVPSALYEIGNGIKSTVPSSVSSFKAILSKKYATQSICSLWNDATDKKLQFSYYHPADKTKFFLTAMAVRPPPHLLG